MEAFLQEREGEREGGSSRSCRSPSRRFIRSSENPAEWRMSVRCMLANLLGCSGLSGCQSSTTGELGQICPSGTSDGPEEPARLGANLDLSSPLLRKIQISARANGWCISQQPRSCVMSAAIKVQGSQLDKSIRVYVCVCVGLQ